MTKSITIIILVFLCLSCSQKKGEYFFDFDKVEYYSLNIDEMELISTLDSPRELTEIQKLEASIVFDDYPESILNTYFITEIGKYDFIKYNVESIFHSEIKEIFKERCITQGEFTSCAKIYRDILIFKNDNRLAGICKICFECNDAYFLGTESNTINFGNNGEFSDLKK